MTIGKKKFEELKHKLMINGFGQYLSQDTEAVQKRLHSNNEKLNITKIAKDLGLSYPPLRMQINKGSRMDESWAKKIEDKLEIS
jgi:hypothetical protein